MDTTTNNPEKLLTMKDFAERVGVSYNTASVWNVRGYPDFPRTIVLPSGQVRIAEADLKAWLRTRMS